MVRILLCFLTLLLVVPAFAGELEDSMKKNDKVLLYLYTPSCGTCRKFEPNYKKLAAAYDKKCGFVKLNANTPYGAKISYQIGVSYVPFVALIESKTSTGVAIAPQCLLDYSCVSKKMDSLLK